MIDKDPSLLFFTEKDNLPLKFGNVLKNTKREENLSIEIELVQLSIGGIMSSALDRSAISLTYVYIVTPINLIFTQKFW